MLWLRRTIRCPHPCGSCEKAPLRPAALGRLIDCQLQLWPVWSSLVSMPHFPCATPHQRLTPINAGPFLQTRASFKNTFGLGMPHWPGWDFLGPSLHPDTPSMHSLFLSCPQLISKVSYLYLSFFRVSAHLFWFFVSFFHRHIPVNLSDVCLILRACFLDNLNQHNSKSES